MNSKTMLNVPRELLERCLYDRWMSETTRKELRAFLAEPDVEHQQCCTPTPEEKQLLANGDYTPEELWGGRHPTCPNCINREQANEQ